jgi:hypothetical protein
MPLCIVGLPAWYSIFSSSPGVMSRRMVPNDYPELYETYAEGCMLNRTSELGRHMTKLAMKLANMEEEPAVNGKKRFGLFG